jgi:ABC-type xylose transport system permease subunit
VRRAFGDALISAAALVVLLVGLVAIDDRVRERVLSVIQTGEVSSSVGSVTSIASDVAGVLMMAARDQSLDHAPLAVFVVAATALVLAMLRL